MGIAADVVATGLCVTLWLLLVRWVQSKLNKESTWGKAIAYIYH